jgi:cystathionine gamma-lyase
VCPSRCRFFLDPYHGQGTNYLHIKGDLHSDRIESENPSGAVVVPISLATTFRQKTPGEATASDDPNSFGAGYEYSRTGNPTRGAFERAVATAEKAEYCVAFASGSAATSAVIHLLQHGDHVICVDDVYGGTQRYFRRIVTAQMGISIDFRDLSKGIPLESETKLVWLETPTNPTLKLTDIAFVAAKAREQGCILAVDNTFCSPYFQNPLDHGADLVVHSVTKYLGGHSDVVMGVVCTNREDLYKKLRFIQNGVGAVPSPFECFLAHRGLKTLHVRMEAAARNAYAIALFLEQHRGVDKVVYPGLPSHPQHDLAKRQQHGFGAMITFYCVGGREQSAAVLQSVRTSLCSLLLVDCIGSYLTSPCCPLATFVQLRVFALAESLGAVESLAECPSLMTHASVPDDQRALLGINDTLIRLSVGIESCRDLIDDLDNALNAALETMS